MSHPNKINIAVIGVGGVGKAFLAQLEALSHRYLSLPTASFRLALVYVSRSSKAIKAEFGSAIPFSEWESRLEQATEKPLAPHKLVEFLSKEGGKAVVIDNTSNQDVAESYPDYLKHGISVATPNKKAFSSDIQLWNDIFGNAANGTGPPSAGYIFHESSVGASLPVISTLKDLIETGDIVQRIEGVFSGTMSFLFNSFMPAAGGGASFSEELKKAKELGYTEPDPRDDLNGMDVARKVTILARLAGMQVQSTASFSVQSLIPKELEAVESGDEFVAKYGDYEKQIADAKKEAESEGKVLRYVGSIELHKGELEVALKKFDKTHPLAGLKGSENSFNFYTKRYGNSPLIINGPGAGGEITAMGVTADLIKILHHIQ